MDYVEVGAEQFFRVGTDNCFCICGGVIIGAGIQMAIWHNLLGSQYKASHAASDFVW
jgi:hypothetical protein